jgi:hypothetical protein
VEARESPVLLSRLPNWSPTIDFAVVGMKNEQIQTASNQIFNASILDVPTPERIFALTGRGKQSDQALSEIRHGHEAHLLMETSGLEGSITEAWYLPSEWNHADYDMVDVTPNLILLTIGGRSELLLLASNSAEVEALNQSHTLLDLSYPTIVAAAYRGIIIQVTERQILISPESPL